MIYYIITLLIFILSISIYFHISVIYKKLQHIDENLYSINNINNCLNKKISSVDNDLNKKINKNLSFVNNEIKKKCIPIDEKIEDLVIKLSLVNDELQKNYTTFNEIINTNNLQINNSLNEQLYEINEIINTNNLQINNSLNEQLYEINETITKLQIDNKYIFDCIYENMHVDIIDETDYKIFLNYYGYNRNCFVPLKIKKLDIIIFSCGAVDDHNKNVFFDVNIKSESECSIKMHTHTLKFGNIYKLQYLEEINIINNLPNYDTFILMYISWFKNIKKINIHSSLRSNIKIQEKEYAKNFNVENFNVESIILEGIYISSNYINVMNFITSFKNLKNLKIKVYNSPSLIMITDNHISQIEDYCKTINCVLEINK
jgi:hypothetical protein